jgi:hypothetical protein
MEARFLADLGVRLQLFVGPNVPRPAPSSLAEALSSLEVNTSDRERSGFQIAFTLDNELGQDFGLLKDGLLEPPNRLIAMVSMGTISSVLVDGIITHHQVVPSNQPGGSVLHVTGEDISIKLDLEERSTTYHNQSDAGIVKTVLGKYATYGIRPEVKETSEAPTENERITTQQGTDLELLQKLAKRNGFVFYIEPLDTPGQNTAYWGPEKRQGQPQPALSMNMGSLTNVDSPVVFSYNSLGPVEVQGTRIEQLTGSLQPVPQGSLPFNPLSNRPSQSIRKAIARDTANLNPIQAGLKTLSGPIQSSEAINAKGDLDALRYGHVLRPRRLVGFRGAGQNYDGNYYVKQVTHIIKQGEYMQKFTLIREGRGPVSQAVSI